MNIMLEASHSFSLFALLDFKLVYHSTCILFFFLIFFVVVAYSLEWCKQAIYDRGMALLSAADFASFEFVNIHVGFFEL